VDRILRCVCNGFEVVKSLATEPKATVHSQSGHRSSSIPRYQKVRAFVHLLTHLVRAHLVRGHLELSRLLIESGANINAQPFTDSRSTPLSLASGEGHLEILLENGADHNFRLWNETPLYRAWTSGRSEFAELLLKMVRADINASNLDGGMVLHRASRRGDQKAARQLLEHSANVHLRNHQGGTSLQVAPRWRNEDIVQLLLQVGESWVCLPSLRFDDCIGASYPAGEAY